EPPFTELSPNIAAVNMPQSAMSFDGNDVITTSMPATQFANLTVSAWVNPSSYASYRAIVQTSTNGDRAMYLSNDKLHWYASSVGTTVIPLNQWTHLTVTIDSNNVIKYYVNGQLDSQRTGNSDHRYFEYLRIGGQSTGDGECFRGMIGEVAVYDRLLSAEDIQLLASTKADVVSQDGLKAYLPMNDAASADMSENGYAVTVQGATWVENAGFSLIDMTSEYGYIEVPSSTLDGLVDFSLSAYVKAYGTQPVFCLLDAPGTNGIKVYYDGIAGRWHVNIGSDEYDVKDSTVSDLAWHMVTIVRESDKLKIIIDGNEAGEVTVQTDPVSVSSADAYIGRDEALEQFSRLGIRDISMWQRALTAVEVSDLRGSSPEIIADHETSLRAWWPADVIEGGLLADATGNGNAAAVTECIIRSPGQVTASRNGILEDVSEWTARDGINIVHIRPDGSAEFMSWDTSQSDNADAMAAYLAGLVSSEFTRGSVILFSKQGDTAMAGMTETAFTAIEDLGAKDIRNVAPEASWSMAIKVSAVTEGVLEAASIDEKRSTTVSSSAYSVFSPSPIQNIAGFYGKKITIAGSTYEIVPVAAVGESVWGEDPTVITSRTLNFDSGDLEGFVTGGSAYWSNDSGAARSGDIGDGQMTYMERTVETLAAGNIEFDWRVSSEGNYDYLRFFIDGVEKAAISGETGWTRGSFELSAGQHTIRWEYSKDGSVSSGSDSGWIDNLVIPGMPLVGLQSGAEGSLALKPAPAYSLFDGQNTYLTDEKGVVAIGEKDYFVREEAGKIRLTEVFTADVDRNGIVDREDLETVEDALGSVLIERKDATETTSVNFFRKDDDLYATSYTAAPTLTTSFLNPYGTSGEVKVGLTLKGYGPYEAPAEGYKFRVSIKGANDAAFTDAGEMVVYAGRNLYAEGYITLEDLPIGNYEVKFTWINQKANTAIQVKDVFFEDAHYVSNADINKDGSVDAKDVVAFHESLGDTSRFAA
ncbi:MAG: hypothetical protein PHT95_07715, partial [Candidatus Omnitrophica bacterium]|nr:hypothetical protein [Candidatus Omnitrophota bacterium]